jgi:hypothetical protein
MNTAFTTVARWWRQWTATRADLDRLNRCGSGDIERIAQDVGVSTSELCALAGKWPDAAEQLNRRLAALDLDPKDIRSVEPQVLHDLQRVCTVCSDKRECERDLAENPAGLMWRAYCPNVMTLDALRSGRKSTEAFSGKVETGFPQKMRPPMSKVN